MVRAGHLYRFQATGVDGRRPPRLGTGWHGAAAHPSGARSTMPNVPSKGPGLTAGSV